jgi:hypothetical protein
MFEEQPLVSLAARPSVNFHQRPLTEHLLPVHPKGELPCLDPFDSVVRLDELERTVVPDDDVAATVVAGRDHALE